MWLHLGILISPGLFPAESERGVHVANKCFGATHLQFMAGWCLAIVKQTPRYPLRRATANWGSRLSVGLYRVGLISTGLVL